ncbi:HPr family phosphocarrier protein [Ruminococcus sp. CLA-AA-H200]|uniref:HPr family phosphocarrier protein n=1 Tax=Ruminococcus turbiniformis TaxID=2881258 RepID=A0ABS8FWZ9_9FIRM|nr:HPr family phosphocarrier protein [Ruminococcus turbiniformis]MCC2254491.1 HPr family phosphocarrier protein [Ruminococcus turbiniformis]
MKQSFNIQFRSLDAIEKFSYDIANLKGQFDLVCGRKTVDAKSFLGILSLDLSGPLTLYAWADDEKSIEVLKNYQV